MEDTNPNGVLARAERAGFGRVAKILHTATVLHRGWELDNSAWVVEREDGTVLGITTCHSSHLVEWDREAAAAKLSETLASADSIRAALTLLNGPVAQASGAYPERRPMPSPENHGTQGIGDGDYPRDFDPKPPNPEAGGIPAKAAGKESRDPRCAILDFRAAFRECFRLGFSPPTGTAPILALQGARLQVLALLLEVDLGTLSPFLDLLVWESDLSSRQLDAARNESGLPVPVLSHLNGPGFRTSLELLTTLLGRGGHDPEGSHGGKL